VGRTKTDDTLSPYYPPRARWYSWVFVPWLELRRVLHLERIRLPSGISAAQCLFCLLIPGYAFFSLGRRFLGYAAFASYCLAGVLFAAGFGYFTGSFAFAMMISAHATSIVYLEGRWLAESSFRARLGAAVATLIALWAFVYYPLAQLVERHWFMPMRIGNNVVIVQRRVSAASVQRGDWIACRIGSQNEPGVYLRSGFAIEPVLALAGDRVEFTKEALFVNGNRLPRNPQMPVAGEFVVPPKTWFIWPRLGIYQHGNEGNVPAMMFRVGMVPETEFIGKPFKRWFGRSQKLS
jgi:hypothetical protein